MPELEPYQITGASFLAARPRAGLFDEPGLGKTAQVIRARELAGARKTLVVCPAGVRQVWPYEFRQWGRDGARVVRAKDVFDVFTWVRGAADVLVVSYEQASSWKSELAQDFFDLLVLDEAHYAKNEEARRTRALLGSSGISNLAERVWFVTGTPMKNDPLDIWTFLHTAGATALSKTAFQSRYFTQRYGAYSTTNTVRPALVTELKHMLRSTSIMRTFDDVGASLPPVRLDVLPVDGDSSVITDYLKSYPGLSERLAESIAGGTLQFDDATHVSTLRSLIAEAKAPGYARLITDELKSGAMDKLVVMAYHRKAIDLVRDHLRRAGINAESITGSTTEAAREKIVRSFQDDANGVRVVVGNIQAAGTGITLNAACRLDMLESSWTPADNVQAVRRVRRKGQARSTLVRFVMLQDSFDNIVASVVVRKANDIVTVTGKDNLTEAMAQVD